MRAARFLVPLTLVAGAAVTGCTIIGGLTDYDVQDLAAPAEDASIDGAISDTSVPGNDVVVTTDSVTPSDGEIDTATADTAPPPDCTKDEDCFGPLGGATPVGCAEATCSGEGKCQYRSKDLDGDTHRAAVCTVGSLTIELGDDCDDANDKVHPGAYDGPPDGTHLASCDGIDNDCNKTTDDGVNTELKVCACVAAATSDCSELPDGTPINFPTGTPLGACKKGTRTCDAAGAWGACTNAVAPAAPSCATTNDLDCDGATDDTQISDCSTTDGCAGKRCGATGACEAGANTKTWGIDADNDGYCAGTTAFCIGKVPGAGFREVSTCKVENDDCDTNAAAFKNVVVRSDGDGDTHCSGTTSTVCTTGAAPTGKRLSTSCVAPDDACDSTAAAWTTVTVRADADGDGHCVGAASTACTTGSAPSGMRLSTTCVAPDDACDSTGGAWTTVTVRADADGDGHCAGAASTACTTGGAPGGTRLSTSCVAPDDACDGTANAWVIVNVRADADGDSRCVGGASNVCTTGGAPGGTRLAASCVGEDCNDGDGGAYTFINISSDGDNDGWCVNNAFNWCGNGSPPTGWRLTSNCAGYDCKDDNNQAKSYCETFPINGNQYTVNGGAIGVTSTGGCNSGCGDNVCNCRPFSGSCPAGFHLDYCTDPLALVSGSNCSRWINNGPTSGAIGTWSGEVRLGISAWQSCTASLTCRCAAN